VDSTHKFALRLIESGKAEEGAIVAAKQTSGIGRCGRTWESPSGNLYASIIRRLFLDRDWGKLSLAVACAVHKVISRYVSSDLYLHWPNDIYYKESKVAGILISIIDCWMIISIGINVHSTPDIAEAISLSDISEVKVIEIDDILKGILTELDEWLETSCVSNFSSIKNYWLRYVNEINSKVIIKNGKNSIAGFFKGIDNSGRLVLDREGKNLFISSGDMVENMKGIMVNNE
jgi:BirA family biotin operon repressor/biotin-[acetyl-CoA-carboxylase] ligase